MSGIVWRITVMCATLSTAHFLAVKNWHDGFVVKFDQHDNASINFFTVIKAVLKVFLLSLPTPCKLISLVFDLHNW